MTSSEAAEASGTPLVITASPKGARVGVACAAVGTFQLLITVAPKIWRAGPRRDLLIDKWPSSRHVELSVYELDLLQDESADAERSRLLQSLLGSSRRMIDGEVSWDSSMLVPDVAVNAPLAYGAASRPMLQSETANLMRLFQNVDLILSDADDLLGQPRKSPLHRPLLYRRFISEVADRLHSARRGYRAVHERRVAIRGRASAQSVARYQATGDPILQCRYDELTESTILLGVVATALEWIADGRGVRSPFHGSFSEIRLRHDAVVLRRALGEVATLPFGRALHEGGQLRLNRLDQPWSAALRVALSILREREPVAAEHGARDITAVELSVPTEKLWERVVHEALKRAGFVDVLNQRQQPPGLMADPWIMTSGGRTTPDNVARTPIEVFVVDAKYKTPKENTPSRDDQYQMFAYSHLVRDQGRDVRAAVLVYPGREETKTWFRGRDETERPVELFAVQVPFPMPNDLIAAAAWSSYLDRVAALLAEELRLVDATALRAVG